MTRHLLNSLSIWFRATLRRRALTWRPVSTPEMKDQR